MLVLEGELQDRTNAFARNHPLGDFLAALPGLAVRPVARGIADDDAASSPTRSGASRRGARRLRGRAHVLAARARRQGPMALQRGSSACWWSPPSSARRCSARLSESGAGHVLVSRADELAPLPAESLAHFAEVHVLNEGAEVEPDDVEHDGSARRRRGRQRPARQALRRRRRVGRARLDGVGQRHWAAFETTWSSSSSSPARRARWASTRCSASPAAPRRAPRAPRSLHAASRPRRPRIRSRRRSSRASASCGSPWRAHHGRRGSNESPRPGDDEGAVPRATSTRKGARSSSGQGSRPTAGQSRSRPSTRRSSSLSSTGASATFARLSFQALTSFFAFRLRAEDG